MYVEDHDDEGNAGRRERGLDINVSDDGAIFDAYRGARKSGPSIVRFWFLSDGSDFDE